MVRQVEAAVPSPPLSFRQPPLRSVSRRRLLRSAGRRSQARAVAGHAPGRHLKSRRRLLAGSWGTGLRAREVRTRGVQAGGVISGYVFQGPRPPLFIPAFPRHRRDRNLTILFLAGVEHGLKLTFQGKSGQQGFFTMKTFRNAAMVAAVMLAVTTSPASACAGGGWRILHLEWLCCWIWGNNHKGCKQTEPGP